MLKKIVIIGLLIGALGCGGDKAQPPVYDTTANPHGFPGQACSLLDRIDAGQLATYDLITDAFRQLYTDHPELLDNSSWRTIIDRLGPIFLARADELADRGVGRYGQAAGFYTLASFAQPENQTARNKQILFAAWTEGLADLAGTSRAYDDIHSLSGAVALARHFLLGEDSQQEFARKFLMDGYLGPLIDSLPPGHVENSLSVHDRAFLNAIGMAPLPSGKSLIEYSEPEVNLISASLIPLGSGNLRLELYLAARKPIDCDWMIALDGAKSDTFSPPIPTSTWAEGTAVLVGRTINYLDPDTGLSLAWVRAGAASSSPEQPATEFIMIPGLSLSEVKD